MARPSRAWKRLSPSVPELSNLKSCIAVGPARLEFVLCRSASCEASWAPSASLVTSSAGLTKHSRSERWIHVAVRGAHVDDQAVTWVGGSITDHAALSDEEVHSMSSVRSHRCVGLAPD